MTYNEPMSTYSTGQKPIAPFSDVAAKIAADPRGAGMRCLTVATSEAGTKDDSNFRDKHDESCYQQASRCLFAANNLGANLKSAYAADLSQ